ncbi:MAG: hypothetical protein AB4040_06790 [Synechococcus sp.]
MRVFIVRPFGTKEGIDFDHVQKESIEPALLQLGIAGGTTGEIVGQGNIRMDMFEQLLVADLVIADISIHNANVFYELGICHALQDRPHRSQIGANPLKALLSLYFTLQIGSGYRDSDYPAKGSKPYC